MVQPVINAHRVRAHDIITVSVIIHKPLRDTPHTAINHTFVSLCDGLFLFCGIDTLSILINYF